MEKLLFYNCMKTFSRIERINMFNWDMSLGHILQNTNMYVFCDFVVLLALCVYFISI